MSALAAYIRDAASTPWKPGEHDCCAWPARWAGIAHPAYATDEEGQRILDEAGGMVALWAAAIGDRLAVVETPQQGDVGIVEAIGRAGSVEVGAIFTGQRWAFLTPKGVAAASVRHVKVWRLPCPRS